MPAEDASRGPRPESRHFSDPRPGSAAVETMLNEAQQRSVSTTMRMLERALAEQEYLLQEQPARHLTRRNHDVGEETAAGLRSLAAEAQQEIQVIAALCHLGPASESVRSVLLGSLSVLWADLEDARPEKLRRYGDVDPRTIAALSPHVDRLISLVLAMQAALAR